MTETVSALYDSYEAATTAVNALESSGIPASDVSMVSNNVDNRYAKDRTSNAGEDAGKGAGIGAVVGGVGGLLTGLGLLAIPGVGPVVAAGWLVATAVGAAGGAVVGGAAGGHGRIADRRWRTRARRALLRRGCPPRRYFGHRAGGRCARARGA